LMQQGEHVKEDLGTLKIKQATSTTGRDVNQLVVGDSISFSCPEGKTISGDPNGPRGCIGVVDEHGVIKDVSNGGAFPKGCQFIKYTIRGHVTNPRNGESVAGAKVVIGDLESTTSAGGIYDIEGVIAGKHNIVATKAGYYKGEQDIHVVANTEAGGLADVQMVNVLTNDEWAVQLTWETNDDLDMEATWADKKVFYGKNVEEAAGITGKFLMDSAAKGPEIVSMSNVGTCNIKPYAYHCNLHVKVHSDKSMEKSGAIAKVWHGSTLAGTFKIGECLKDVTEGGKWWHVFTLNTNSNALKWTCNGKAGAASLLQEAEMSIPAKQSASNLIPRKNVIDYSSYVGPFPGRFFRHSIKRSKNSTVAVGTAGKKLRSKAGIVKKATSFAGLKSSSTHSEPSSTTSTDPITEGHHSKTHSTVKVSSTDPESRIIKGKLTHSKSVPVISSTDSTTQATSLSTSSISSTSTTDSTSSTSMASSTSYGKLKSTTSLMDLSSPRSSTESESSITNRDVVDLKVEPSEIDVRPRGHPQPEGHPQPAQEKKVSPHF